MTVPDGIAMGAIGTIAAFAAYFTKRIADSYFADVKDSKLQLGSLAEKTADEFAKINETHARQCDALEKICDKLNSMEGRKK